MRGNGTESTWAIKSATVATALLPERLPLPLSLPEKSHARVTIETTDAEREAWQKLSEESLTQVWDSDADDGFNQLAAMSPCE